MGKREAELEVLPSNDDPDILCLDQFETIQLKISKPPSNRNYSQPILSDNTLLLDWSTLIIKPY